jgi:hypothetical protein
MKLSTLAFIVISTFALSACGSTFEGLKEDFGNLSAATSNKMADLRTKNTNSALVVSTDSTCPPIIIDPQLDSMAEFEDMEKPNEDSFISRVALTRTQSLCTLTDGALEMRLDMTFSSELGPKARRKKSDRPFFAYPYFISVTDSSGQELAKEIFAASMTYEAGQESVELIETINQNLPLNEDGSIPSYQVHIGFQLTDEQLFYNASQ